MITHIKYQLSAQLFNFVFTKYLREKYCYSISTVEEIGWDELGKLDSKAIEFWFISRSANSKGGSLPIYHGNTAYVTVVEM